MREAARIAGLLAFALAALGAHALPAKNLGFESWDDQGRPDGWRVGEGASGTVAADCKASHGGRCALRLDAGDGATGVFLPVAQPVGAGTAAGHRVKLSGWIRTAGVQDGWAGLWIRADVEGKTTALENMVKEGPRGTNGWRRYEIAVEVPGNATLISFGVLLSGRGTAWFDDLALDVDSSVRVGRAPKRQVVFPPRPRATAEYLSDAWLRLPTTEVPRAKPAWVAAARAGARPIRSLFSDDFSDLAFLKPLLAGKRVVMLGESGHGVAEFNWMKVRLAKFLHRELGFDVVAFESSLSSCDRANARIGRAAPVDVMRDAIFGVWHSTETLALFEYLDAERGAGRPMALAGFDVQPSGRAAPEVSARLVKQLDRVDSALAARIRGIEEQLTREYAEAHTRELVAAYGAAADRLAANREALRKLEARPVEVDVAIRELRSRVHYVGALVGGQSEAGLLSRDRGMADNLDFLLDTLYPGRKVIVWAHNGHIAKSQLGRADPLMMGSWFARRRGAEAYVIGVYMGWGIAARNDRMFYEIKRPDEDSLEAILAGGGWRLSFQDLTHAPEAPRSWADAEVEARTWGAKPVRLVPARAYDGLIYIDAVTPPEYL